MPSETTPQLLARLIHQGGKILIVGGGVNDLPDRYTGHPGLIFWDDNDQEFMNKQVPSNVRAILWNRWISHGAAWKLNAAVKQLRILKFPMLRPREIIELLSEVVREVEPVQVPVHVEPPPLTEQELKANEAEIQQEEAAPMAKKKEAGTKGWLQEFVGKHIDLDVDFKVKGAQTQEGKRIYQKAKAEGLNTTETSVIQAVGVLVRGMSSGRKRKLAAVRGEEPGARKEKVDDFDELDTLIGDAIAALRLVQEHIPKVRKETERLRGMREKVLRLFE